MSRGVWSRKAAWRRSKRKEHGRRRPGPGDRARLRAHRLAPSRGGLNICGRRPVGFSKSRARDAPDSARGRARSPRPCGFSSLRFLRHRLRWTYPLLGYVASRSPARPKGRGARHKIIILNANNHVSESFKSKNWLRILTHLVWWSCRSLRWTPKPSKAPVPCIHLFSF